MASSTEVHGATDGRTARRDRNRTAVLDAVLALFAEGTLSPSADEVARRSGVSLRSVYRYVENADDLVRAAVARRREQVAPLFVVHGLGRGALDERVAALCRSRVRAYDAVAATSRAARARAYSSAVLRRELDEASRLLRNQVAAQFAPELHALAADDRTAVLAAADALCQMETVELYRTRGGHSAKETAALLGTALRRLLEPTADPEPRGGPR